MHRTQKGYSSNLREKIALKNQEGISKLIDATVLKTNRMKVRSLATVAFSAQEPWILSGVSSSLLLLSFCVSRDEAA